MTSAASTLFHFFTQSSLPLFEGGVPLWLARLGMIALCSILLFLAFPRFRTILLLATSLAYCGMILGAKIEVGILLFCLLWFFLLKLSDLFTDPFQKKIMTGLILVLSSGLYFGLMNLSRWGLKLPRPSVQDLGICYLYLRVIHVTVDWMQGKLGKPGFIRFLVYAFYFPTMMGGPVERYPSFFEGPFFNLENPWRPLFDRGMVLRFIGGLFKIWICTHLLSLPYSQLWDHTTTLPYSVLLKIYYLRAITFYLIVSGINDIILMFSKLMGVPLAENYDYPYFRKNLAHFWRNWHIALSTILRDYIYEPLGGRERHQFLNYLLTFFFCAMWHVTSKAFVLWGLMHGFGMIGLRVWQDFWSNRALRLPFFGPSLGRLREFFRSSPRVSLAMSALVTFHYVALTWLPFWGGYPQGAVAILRLLGLHSLIGPILN